ncbi:MAG: Asp23/Gls24 family envelope stress response protein [Gaiellaceae bacterium]
MATISADILARYAGDAAQEVPGVRGLVGRRAVRVSENGDGVTVELHLGVDWGVSMPDVGREVQRRVGEYLLRMADLESVRVDVVVDDVE